MKLNGYIFLFIISLMSCQTELVREETASKRKLPGNLPESLWVSETFTDKIDSVFEYQKRARQTLDSGDTLGAEIYYNQAFEIIATISDEDRMTLQYWVEFDSMFQELTEDYERIYLQANIAPEAEEIREDISALEELTFPDSVLFGEGTVVDTSNGLPITVNKKVRLAIKYFQTKGRAVFTRWLERSGTYDSLITRIFKEKNLPLDLKYLAMIESGFNPKARSYARAVGMWQFISATGRYYGLRNNWWFDERRDVLKSTTAAAEHLVDLYERFGHWYLALAGYNCNPRKVESNMRRYNTRDFWKLRRLPRQTRNYVPTFLAATIIAKNPGQFGFYVNKNSPLEIDTVKISESVDLNVIANLVNTDYTMIKDLNPAVLRWVTPPGVKDFNVYLPEGTRDKFIAGYANIPEKEKRSWVRHKIRNGETLSTIAQKYHTSISILKSTNHLRSSRIRAGKYLLIPVPQNKSHYYAYKPAPAKSRSKKSYKPKKITNVPGHKKMIHKVKSGETLGGIAEDYNTRASKIRSWNGLRYGQYIYPKQDLTIWVPENFDDIKKQIKNEVKIQPDDGSYYIVKRGDTLWDIARKYNTSISKLKRMNNMRTSSIRPGDRIKISTN